MVGIVKADWFAWKLFAGFPKPHLQYLVNASAALVIEGDGSQAEGGALELEYSFVSILKLLADWSKVVKCVK